jgi:uncharacterized phage protein gp47/JayE
MAGLTTSGFTVATTEELRTIISNTLKTNLGGDIDTNPSSRIGQFIDVMAENLSSLWQALEAVYNSQYPSTASGTSLDYVGSITNTSRNPGRYGVARVYFNGTLGTVIPAGSVIANQNGYELTTTTTGTIMPNAWLLYSDLLPINDKCSFDLRADTLRIGVLDIYNDNSAAVIKQNIIDASVNSYSISGSRNGSTATITTNAPFTGAPTLHKFPVGRQVTQTGTDGGLFNGTFTIISVTDTTYTYADTGSATFFGSGTTTCTILSGSEIEVIGQFDISGAVWIKFTPTTVGRIYYLDFLSNDMGYSGGGAAVVNLTTANSTDIYIEAVASVLQNQEINPHSIIEIVSPISNIEAVANIEVGTSGLQRQTDADYRLQLQNELNTSESNTVAGIKSTLSALVGVSFVGIIENKTNATVDGRAPFSYEVFVEGGDSNELAQTIYDTHPPGISVVTTDLAPRSGTYTDVNGTIGTLQFSNVQKKNVFVQVTGTKNSSYPSNGNTLMTDAVTDYINARLIGETLYKHNIFTPANTIPGVITLSITMQGTSGGANVDFVTPTNIQRVFLGPGNISITIT